jgi:hypothetical protein
VNTVKKDNRQRKIKTVVQTFNATDEQIDDPRIRKWDQWCNAKQKGVDWQFAVEKARIKLKTLHPKIIEKLKTRAIFAFLW